MLAALGLIGPAEGHDPALRRAAELLVEDMGIGRAIYLGAGETLDRVVEAWAWELALGDPSEAAFLSRAARARAPDDVDALLARDARVARLSALRKLPLPPCCAAEMLGDRILLFAHDSATLDEDDMWNAHFVAFGGSDETMFNRIGTRVRFSPGPASRGTVGVLGLDESGALSLTALDVSGRALWCEQVSAPGPRVSVFT